VRIGVKPGQWGWTFAELEASWRLAEEVGFDLLACFDHVTAAPEERQAWDGPSLLTAMAARTEAICLAIHVVNASLRNPLLLAGQIAVAQASSGGRVEVGIGAGSHHFARYDHEATGIPFPAFRERVNRLEASCRLLPALWRGERVTDETVGLCDAGLGPIEITPPRLFVGGSSDAVLRITARFADGWHAPGDEGRFAEFARRLDRFSADLGRPPVEKSIQIRGFPVEGLRERVDRLRDAGASTVVFVLDVDRASASWVRRLAVALL
jgi:alkanesulfonate monooxygenase SsuD/methylene tetrahydromethanopterin reductase-like flavin-dependent oxidoreductase (luciferase family)